MVVIVLFLNLLINKYMNNIYDTSDISNSESKNINDNIITKIKTSKNIIEIDNKGRIAQVTLLGENNKDINSKQIKLFEHNQLRPLEVRFADTNINEKAFKLNAVANKKDVDAKNEKQELIITQDLGETVLTKKFTFYPNGHYALTTTTTNDKKFFITNGFRPNVLADMYTDHGVMAKLNDGTLTIIEDGDLDKNLNIIGAKFVSNFDRYYATVIYNFEKSLSLTLMPDFELNPQAFINSGNNISFSGFIGPKNFNDLNSLSSELTDIIEFGFGTSILKPIHSMLNN